jgi:uncharacterized protein (DUF697 family)
MSEAEKTTTECPERRCHSRKICNYMLGSMALCLVPALLFDLAAITALQLKMVSELAEDYGQSFKESLGRSLILSLVGTLGAAHLAAGTFFSLAKLMPGIGHVVAALSQPVMIGATTYALGRVFEFHFATGGTLLDFDVEKMREHFRKEFAAGLDIAKQTKAKA